MLAPPSAERPTATCPPWASAIARTIASPRPGPAGGAIARGIGAMEAIEDTLALIVRNARPVVLDPEP